MNDVKTVVIGIVTALIVGVAGGALGMKGCTEQPAPTQVEVVRYDTVRVASTPDTVIVHRTTREYVPREPLIIDGDCDRQIAVRDSLLDDCAYEKWHMSNVVAEAVLDGPEVTGSIHFLMNEFLKDPRQGFAMDLRSMNTTSVETVTVSECQKTWWDSVKDYALVGTALYVLIDVVTNLVSFNK